jgi:hypothetical protein
MAGPKIQCVSCEDVIQSKYRHDFVSCKCGDIFIDGGDDYTRIGCKDEGSYIEVKDSDTDD